MTAGELLPDRAGSKLFLPCHFQTLSQLQYPGCIPTEKVRLDFTQLDIFMRGLDALLPAELWEVRAEHDLLSPDGVHILDQFLFTSISSRFPDKTRPVKWTLLTEG